MSYQDGPTRGFPSNSALGKGIRVKLAAGFLVVATAADVGLGAMEYRTLSGDEMGTVRLRTAQGTQLRVASGSVTAGNAVYAAASGKAASSGTVYEGTALESASDGDLFEILPGPNTDIATSLSGTSAAAFEVDNDGAYPTIELAAQTAGTGDYKATIKPPSTLTAARVYTLPVDGASKFVVDYCQSVTPNSTEVTGNTILAGVSSVDVGTVANDANDFVVLPAIANVPIGFTIRIAANAGGNFELRTPASSNTKINDVDSDGTQEYLCTDTDLIIVTKRTTTGWAAQSITKLGAVRTAVVPD